MCTQCWVWIYSNKTYLLHFLVHRTFSLKHWSFCFCYSMFISNFEQTLVSFFFLNAMSWNYSVLKMMIIYDKDLVRCMCYKDCGCCLLSVLLCLLLVCLPVAAFFPLSWLYTWYTDLKLYTDDFLSTKTIAQLLRSSEE